MLRGTHLVLCTALAVSSTAGCERESRPTDTRPTENKDTRPARRVEAKPAAAPDRTDRDESEVADRSNRGGPSGDPTIVIQTECFAVGYPEHVTKIRHREDAIHIEAGDTEFLWDDGRDKTFEQKLSSPDLEDTVSMTYPIGEPGEPPEPDEDPGRIRHDGFLQHVYGDSEAEVRDNLVSVEWPGEGTVAFNERNGAAAALEAVADELTDLPGEYKKYFTETAGTFNWRTISGTERMSAHSYAIAIDLNVDYSNYWRWQDKTGENLEYENRIPWAIVEVFERHGFIWGGKWHHYDTMHFEYRPELFASGCYRRYQD